MNYISDPSLENLVGVCSENVIAAIKDAWSVTKTSHIVITGGLTGFSVAKAIDIALFRLIRENSSFEGCMLHIWFSDERFVPFDSPDRNDTGLIEAFGLSKSHVVFHRVAESGSLDEAAKRYAAELELEIADRPFDAVVLSMGEDGHIASLFPEAFDPQVATGAIAVHNSPKAPPERVSISLKRLAAALHIFLFAVGEGKSAALQNIQTGPVGQLEKSSPNGQLLVLTDLTPPQNN